MFVVVGEAGAASAIVELNDSVVKGLVTWTRSPITHGPPALEWAGACNRRLHTGTSTATAKLGRSHGTSRPPESPWPSAGNDLGDALMEMLSISRWMGSPITSPTRR